MQLPVNHMSCTPRSIRTPCLTLSDVTIRLNSRAALYHAAGDWAERCTPLQAGNAMSWETVQT